MKKNKNILILHIPHSSRKLPNEFFSVCTLTKKELNFYLNKMTDNFTYELFGKNSHKKVAAKFSRLYCDVERFCQESKEPMEKLGMGMIYTKTFDGKNLSIPTEKYKEKIKKQYYEKYHEKFDKLIFKNKNKNIIIIDCHSFSNEMAKLTQNVQDVRTSALVLIRNFQTMNLISLQNHILKNLDTMLDSTFLTREVLFQILHTKTNAPMWFHL